MTILTDLTAWFQQQCNDDWEHQYGITIRSTDNPGWWVTIDLQGTALQDKKFEPILRGDFAAGSPQPPWLHCRVVDLTFQGAGDVTQLDTILGLFLSWAQPN